VIAISQIPSDAAKLRDIDPYRDARKIEPDKVVICPYFANCDPLMEKKIDNHLYGTTKTPHGRAAGP
jgi:hypothetical protein